MSSIARLSLKKRILIAILAIALIHCLFYAAPRVYCARPRFHEAEYAEALAVLREAVGAQVVEKGIVTIERARVSLPYQAVAGTDYRSLAGGSVCLALGRENFVILTQEEYYNRPESMEVWPLSRAEAESIFAAALYIDRTTADFCDPIEAKPQARAWFVRDATWPLPRRPARHTNEAGLDIRMLHLKRHLLVTFLNRRMAASGPPAGDRAVRARALRTVIEAFVPPAWEEIRGAFSNLCEKYAETASREDLGLLKKIRNYVDPYWSPYRMFYAIPVIGKRLMQRELLVKTIGADTGFPVRRAIADAVWAIEELDGKSDSERFEILKKEAFGIGGIRGQGHYLIAGRLLEQEWPSRWKDLLVENFLPADCWSYQVMMGRDPVIACDERYLKLQAANGNPRAMVILFDSTGDREYLEALRRKAGGDVLSDSDADEALVLLIKDRSKYEGLVDVPTLARQAMKNWLLSREQSVYPVGQRPFFLNAIEDVRDPAFEPLFLELLESPEKVLGEDCSDEGAYLTARNIAGRRLARMDSQPAVEAVARYVTSDRPQVEDFILYSVIEYFESARTPAALPVLETLLTQSENPSATGRRIPGPKGRRSFQEHVKQALRTVRLVAAADPYEYYAALPPDERGRLRANIVAEVPGSARLRRLLLDGRTADAVTRRELLTAIAFAVGEPGAAQ